MAKLLRSNKIPIEIEDASISKDIFHFPGTTAGNFDVVIHNNNLKQAYADLRDFIVRELETQQGQGINVSLTRVPLAED